MQQERLKILQWEYLTKHHLFPQKLEIQKHLLEEIQPPAMWQ